MSENEKLLLEKAKDGNIEAFERLIEGYQKKVFNIALRMIGDYDDASDVAQEVFIRIFRSIKNFKEQSSFSTWVYRITTNVCLDELRKRKNKKVVYLEEEIKLDSSDVKRQIQDDRPTPDALAEIGELKKTINDAINRLSSEHRTAIILRDIQGFSYEEISRIIDCPQGTVKSRINRARRALKELLKPKMELLDEMSVK